MRNVLNLHLYLPEIKRKLSSTIQEIMREEQQLQLGNGLGALKDNN